MGTNDRFIVEMLSGARREYEHRSPSTRVKAVDFRDLLRPLWNLQIG